MIGEAFRWPRATTCTVFGHDIVAFRCVGCGQSEWALAMQGVEMKKDKPLVDQRCYDLAEHFLTDEADQSDERKMALAEAIQTAIEDFLA